MVSGAIGFANTLCLSVKAELFICFESGAIGSANTLCLSVKAELFIYFESGAIGSANALYSLIKVKRILPQAIRAGARLWQPAQRDASVSVI